MKSLAVLFFLLVGGHAQNVEEHLKQVAYNSEYAVLSVYHWEKEDLSKSFVVGTAFLITPDGYFITAAHVLEKYKPGTADLVVDLRQRSRDMAGVWFSVVEKDEAHDLALCKTIVPLRFMPHSDNPGTEQPTASLHISQSPAEVGEFIAISGFPLGSWTPTVQFGNVAATSTLYPGGGRVPAGQRELLKISASGN